MISGIKKGYRLKAPKGKDTRPTEDRIKESLFNILRGIDEESIVLDLFAGSGSIGIEFLSRGANKVYFIDRSYLSIKTIKENLQHTNLEDKSKVVKNDSIKIIESLGRQNIKFNYIFIDPPYEKNLIMISLEKICNEGLLNKDGIIILEHEKELILKDEVYDLKKIDYRNYGDKSLTFYTYSD